MSSNKRKSFKKSDHKVAQVAQPMYPMYQFMPNFMAQQQGAGMQPAPFAMQPGPNGGAFMSQPCVLPQPASSSSLGRASSSRRKSWAAGSDKDKGESDEDDDDDDFAPSKPKKRLSLGHRGSEGTSSGAKKQDKTTSGAAGYLALRRVQNLPPKFMGRPTVSHVTLNDCVSCGIYLGEVMLLPCGHAAFCTKCINKLHDKSNALKRLQICPAAECVSSVSGWVRLHNVMA